MSARVSSCVWDHSTSTGNARLVLLKLAESASAETWLVWDSHEYLRDKTRIDRPRTLQDAVRWLREHGEIELVAGGRGRGRFPVYLIHCAAGICKPHRPWTSADIPTGAGPEKARPTVPSEGQKRHGSTQEKARLAAVPPTPPHKEEPKTEPRATFGAPDSASVTDPEQPPPVTAPTLTGRYIDRCKTRPPDRFVGHLAREIQRLLDEGIHHEAIDAGLELLRLRARHPSLLPALVNEILNPPEARASPNGRSPTVFDHARRRMAEAEAEEAQQR